MSQTITNSQLKFYSSLKQKKFRHLHGLFIADGPHLVEAALGSAWQIEAVLVENDKKNLTRSLRLPASSTVIMVPSAKFARISPSRSPQGVLAIIKMQKTDATIEHLIRSADRTLVLDNINDPGNVGTMIRTAAGLGYDLVVCLGDCAEIYNPKTIRATQGALFKIPIIELSAEREFIDLARGYSKIITFSVKAERPLADAPAIERATLVFGSEIQGISESLDAAADYRLCIEQADNIDSFNVAVAAGIAMYKFRNVKLAGTGHPKTPDQSNSNLAG